MLWSVWLDYIQIMPKNVSSLIDRTINNSNTKGIDIGVQVDFSPTSLVFTKNHHFIDLCKLWSYFLLNDYATSATLCGHLRAQVSDLKKRRMERMRERWCQFTWDLKWKWSFKCYSPRYRLTWSICLNSVNVKMINFKSKLYETFFTF